MALMAWTESEEEGKGKICAFILEHWLCEESDEESDEWEKSAPR